jgi:hypothetical protein
MGKTLTGAHGPNEIFNLDFAEFNPGKFAATVLHYGDELVLFRKSGR